MGADLPTASPWASMAGHPKGLCVKDIASHRTSKFSFGSNTFERAQEFRARAELAVARRLFDLPKPWSQRISGRPLLELDGQVLHPDMQLLLTAMRWRQGSTSLAAENVDVARANMREGAVRYADKPAVSAVRDFSIAGPAGPIPVRHYAPFTATAAPLLVFLHGGGFALGDLDTHDMPCRLLCRSAGVHVLSVDYRLAPEHPCPAGLEDAHAALRWASENAVSLGADPRRIAIGGDSAGGNMSTVIAREVLEQNGPKLSAQLLIYPCTDMVERSPSRELFATGVVLTRTDMDWFDALYTTQVPHEDPRVSPLLAADLSGQCPAIVVTAGFDPLRDEGEAYADALRAAGSQVVSWREPGLMHGFINYAGISRECRRVVKRLGSELAALLR